MHTKWAISWMLLPRRKSMLLARNMTATEVVGNVGSYTAPASIPLTSWWKPPLWDVRFA